MARKGRARVPAWGLAVQGLWAAALVLPRTFRENKYGNLYSDLLDYVMSAALVFYILTIFAVFRLRRLRPDVERPAPLPELSIEEQVVADYRTAVRGDDAERPAPRDARHVFRGGGFRSTAGHARPAERYALYFGDNAAFDVGVRPLWKLR